MSNHHIKATNPSFNDIWSLKSDHIVCKNDKEFVKGDMLMISEWIEEENKVTGYSLHASVSHVYSLEENQTKPDYIMLQVNPFRWSNPAEKSFNSIPFDAMLAYELNAQQYDSPNPHKATHIPKGERIIDFAEKYGTSVDKMKNQRQAVESYIEIIK